MLGLDDFWDFRWGLKFIENRAYICWEGYEMGVAGRCAGLRPANYNSRIFWHKKISSVGGRYKSQWFHVCRIDYHQLFPQKRAFLIWLLWVSRRKNGSQESLPFNYIYKYIYIKRGRGRIPLPH